MNIHMFVMFLCLAATLPALSQAQIVVQKQTLPDAPAAVPSTSADGPNSVTAPVARTAPAYVPPSHSTRLHDYLWETFGPYPVGLALVVGGWNQMTDAVPEWHQGATGYGRRFGSDLGVGAVRTSTRYALAEVLHEDTLYYRCECTGFFPRTGHAILSALTARRLSDGRVTFSLSQLVAPYAGTMVAVYAWYPNRYGPKDGFRMGNYSLLGYMSGNIGLEFLHIGSASLFKRFHLNNAHGAPENEP